MHATSIKTYTFPIPIQKKITAFNTAQAQAGFWCFFRNFSIIDALVLHISCVVQNPACAFAGHVTCNLKY
jgi:hypothetical protein